MYIPKKISQKTVVHNPYLKVMEKKFLESNWKQSSFLIMAHNKKQSEATFVLPVTEYGTMIYLQEFRYGPEKVIINFPVGMLEDNISPIENVKRELYEETGYMSDNIEFLWESIIENYFEGRILYFIAKNCKKCGMQKLECGENIQVCETSIDEFEKMIIDGKVLSSKSAFCFYLAKMKNKF